VTPAKGAGNKKRVETLPLALATLLIALPATAQDRSTLTDDLDIFATTYFDWLQPRSVAVSIEYCSVFGVDGQENLAANPCRAWRYG
jgi:hypothetical protein